jgi:PAS domain S-box-containing protein
MTERPQEAPVVATPRTPVDLARLVSQVADYAIIALDGSGTIQSWNAGAQQVKGYTADEAIGRNFSMFYTEEDRRSGLPLTLLAEARDKGSVEHAGWRVRRDGTQFWGHVIITALHDDAGNVVGFGNSRNP